MRWIKYILFPFSILYWIYTYCRNVCFDLHLLSQTSFCVPIISFGNITVGGTGKTPHVQYAIQALGDRNIATLSRGYKRKSKGFVLADENVSVAELGDEPYLLKQRFPQIHVSVCEKRVDGMNQLLDKITDLQVVVLDDAFQHRYLKPSLQILLVDYNRPLWKDCVFPVGFLREGKYAVNRADAVVVTKCPETLSETERTIWRKKLRLNQQPLFFSTMKYGAVYNFTTKQPAENNQFFANKSICLITGIAQPKPLIEYVESFGGKVTHQSYPDHYSYSESDKLQLQKLSETYIMVTTEKDVYKLTEILPEIDWHVVPIMPQFLFGEETVFNNLLCSL